MSLLTGSRLTPNAWRWTGSLALGFLGGAFTSIADSSAWPGLYAVVRDGLIEMVPVLVALKLILRPRSPGGQAAAVPDRLKGERG